MKKLLLIILCPTLLTGCGAMFGGTISDCQKHKHTDGTHRQIRPAAIVGDILSFPLVALPIDFATGGIYVPCNTLGKPDTTIIISAHRFGQIVINAGVGYSPEFDGAFGLGGTFYPVNTSFNVLWNADSYPYPGFACTTYTMNRGGSIDFGINEYLSIGLAASYQDETIIWWLESTSPGSMSYNTPFSDKISRTNTAFRLLAHAPFNTKHFETYAGLRIGCSFWHDTPASINTYNSNYVPSNATSPPYTFLNSTNMSVLSIQVLFGAHIYINKFIGIHCEVGIGSPYLAECGLSIRINTQKDITTQAQGK